MCTPVSRGIHLNFITNLLYILKILTFEIKATFLEESSKYYRDQSQSLMAFDNLEISVRRISAFIKTEEERIRHYFDKEMGNKIMTVFFLLFTFQSIFMKI